MPCAFIVDRDLLRHMLEAAQRVVTTSTGVLTTTSHCLLRAILDPEAIPSRPDQGFVRLVATDLTTTLFQQAFAQVDEVGELLLPARLLRDIVKRLGPGEVMISEDKVSAGWAVVEQGELVYRLAGLFPDDFPTVADPSLLPEGSSEMGADSLSKAASRVSFSACADSTRPHLQGISCKPQGSRMKLVATDGHRYSQVLSPELLGDRKIGEGTIPVRAVAVLEDAFGKAQVRVSIRDGRLIVSEVSGGHTVLACQLVSGKFPDFSRAITTPKHQVSVETEALATAIDQVALLAPQHGVYLCFSPSSDLGGTVKEACPEGALIIRSGYPLRGEAKAVLPVQYSGQDFEMGANAAYTLEALRAADSKMVLLGVTDELSNLQISVPGEDGCLWLVMPIRRDAIDAKTKAAPKAEVPAVPGKVKKPSKKSGGR